MCGSVVQRSTSCLQLQMNRVRLPATPHFLFLCIFFFLFFFLFSLCFLARFFLLACFSLFVLLTLLIMHLDQYIFLSFSSELYFRKGTKLVHHKLFLFTPNNLWRNSPYAWLRQTSKFHQQASFVNKIFCICTFCAWVFFSTLLPWEFISVKLRLFLISKRGLVVKFACVT